MSSVTNEADKLLASMHAVHDDANGTFVGVPRNDHSTRVKYWKKPDGRIAIGPDVRTDPHMYAQYTQNKRWKELPNEFGNEQKNIGPMSPLKVRRGKEWMWLEPFFAAGGLTRVCSESDSFGKPGEFLMPKEQLVELNLHRFPAILAARPDLTDAVDLECPFSCPDEHTGTVRKFSGVEKRFAQHSVDQHVAVAHKEAIASRAVGQAIAEAFKTVNTNQQAGASFDAQTIAAIVAATVAALKPQETAAVAAQAVEQQGSAVFATPDILLYGARDPQVNTSYKPRAPSVWIDNGKQPDTTTANTSSIPTHNELLSAGKASLGWETTPPPLPLKRAHNPISPAIIPEGVPDEGWSRQAMMKWASSQPGFPTPERAFKLKTSEWLEWIRNYLPMLDRQSGMADTQSVPA